MASSKLLHLLLLPTFLLSLFRLSSCQSGVSYEIKNFTQILDHFNFYPNNVRTFQQRYLINDTYWGGAASAAPIFVYLGGEGGIERTAKAVGFPFDTAPDFKALLVFIEHRFYGWSFPFADQNPNNPKELGYLSISQALSDFATLIADLKRNLTAERSPVIVFGTSYSGTLAAYFRLKYPHIAHGALASSAPLLLNYDLASQYAFDDVITRAYKNQSENCYQVFKSTIANVFLTDLTKEKDRSRMSEIFHICKNYEGEDANVYYHPRLYGWITQAVYNSAERGYPIWYHGVPPYPLKKMCAAIDNPKTGNDNYSRVSDAMQVYYNSSGNISCFDLVNPPKIVMPEGVNGPQFPWQDCSEIQSANIGRSEDSLFIPQSFNFTEYSTFCKMFKPLCPQPRRYSLTTEFGGHDIKNVLKRFGSNIIFFNGLIDPWSAGGVLESISESIVAITAREGAHGVDMRFNSKEYPQWFQDIRNQEIQIISKWLQEYHEDRM